MTIARRHDAVTFDVPSNTLPDVTYLVTFIGDPLKPERASCNCPARKPVCSHIVNAARTEELDRQAHRDRYGITLVAA